KERECFDSAFFGYTDAEAKVMDPQSRILHQVVWEALEDAGCIPGIYEGAIGLFAGAGSSLKWEAGNFLSGNDNTLGKFSTTILGSRDFMCSGISYKLNLKGPSLFIQTACSTSLVAIHEACRSILTGECQVALAGGVTIGYESRDGYIYEDGMIYSRDGHCKPFDRDASGTVPSEGACIVALKSLEDAIKDHNSIYAVIKGTAINNDGQNKVGYTSPSVQGQESVIKMAHSVAEIDSNSIGYIETHGTGTSLGDMVEVEALKQVFNDSDNDVILGSVKSNVGHMDCAAGVAGFIKTVMILKHGIIPPTCHFQNENPHLNLSNSPFKVNAQLIPWGRTTGMRYAGVSSFGIGGTNAHAVLEEFQIRDQLDNCENEDEILIISAKTSKALQQMKDNLQNFINQHPEARLKDISYTLQIGRKPFPLRSYAVVKGSIPKTLTFVDAKHDLPNVNPDRPVIFMFHSVDHSLKEIVRSLYCRDIKFKEIADQCIDVVIEQTGIERLVNGLESSRIEVLIQKPWLNVYSYAKYIMLKGVTPSCLSSSGYGVLVALCLSEIIDMKDMVRILYPNNSRECSDSFDLFNKLEQIDLLNNGPVIPLLSPVTGKWWEESDLNLDSIYNCCLTKLNKVGIQSLQFILDEFDRPLLITSARSEEFEKILDGSNARILNICDEKYYAGIGIIGEIWNSQGDINWKQFNNNRSDNCYLLNLPTYPFEETKYTFDQALYRKNILNIQKQFPQQEIEQKETE
ncbi:beta-ketoacyl synthase N-terminal-like domain-containing protein, partial [Streptomyces koyangensis]